MIAGTHPRARSIGAIIEEPDYHARLLEYVREFRAASDVQRREYAAMAARLVARTRAPDRHRFSLGPGGVSPTS